MQNLSYWKSKRHVVIFIAFAAIGFISVLLFIASFVAAMVSKAPSLKEDPVANALLFAFVMSVVFEIAFSIIFFVDLILFFVQRNRIKKAKGSNFEVVLKESPVTINTEDKKITTVTDGGIIADITTNEESRPNYELDAKEEYKPSYRHNMIVQLYGSWPALAAGVPVIILFLMALCLLLNLNNIKQGFINTLIASLVVITVVGLLLLLIPALLFKRQKTLTPVDAGLRIYDDTIEYYVEIDQELKGQKLKATLKTKFNFSLAKHLETKSYYLMKQKVNGQMAVLIVEKKTADERLIPLIKEKFANGKAAKSKD